MSIGSPGDNGGAVGESTPKEDSDDDDEVVIVSPRYRKCNVAGCTSWPEPRMP